MEEPRSLGGIPVMANADMAKKIIELVAEYPSPLVRKSHSKMGLGL